MGTLKHITIEVDGQLFSIDPDEQCRITEVSSDLAEVAAKLSWIGRIKAAAGEAAGALEDRLRGFHGAQATSILASDPKLAEWKVKARIDGSRDARVLRDAVRRAQRVHNELSSLYDSVKEKSFNLRTLGGMHRTEFGAEKGSVVYDERPVPNGKDDAAKTARLSSKVKSAVKRTTIGWRQRANNDNNNNEE